MSNLNTPNEEEFAAHIGIDWADRKHFWAMRTAEGKLQRGELVNTPEAIQIWAAELAQRFGGRPVAVALEQSRGAVIAMLSMYAHLVLFPIHPNTVANYRKALYPSGAKSDPQDADLILELRRTHPDKFRRLDPDTVETRKLQFLTEERRKLVNQHTSELQRLLAWLKQIFPQILQWFEDPGCAMVGAFLLRWPTLPALQKASPKVLRRFFTQHNCRSEEAIQERLQKIPLAVVATTDAALVESASMSIQNSVRLLEVIARGHCRLRPRHPGNLSEPSRPRPDGIVSGSRAGAGTASDCGGGITAGALQQRRQYGQFFGHRAGEGIERQCRLDPLALGLSQVYPADVSPMGGMLHSDLRLGAGVLRRPARQG
jgi:hypothetical protein